MTAAAIDQKLAAIARQTLDIATLETRNSDALDFHTLSIWQIKTALQLAYQAGRDAAAGGAP